MLGQPGSFLPGMLIKGKYTVVKKIAETELANVYVAQTQGKELLAVKAYNITKLRQHPNYEYLVKCFIKEVELTKNLHNPHIVRYRDHIIDNDQAILISEFCDGGDLAQALKKRGKPFSEEECMLMLYFLLKAMREISRSKIVHRDIKPENIFLHSRNPGGTLPASTDDLLKHYTVKIGDFGIAREYSTDIRSFVGTEVTMAPEVVQGRPYDQSCDVWSLGVTMFILQTGRDPWFKHDYLNGTNATFEHVPAHEKPSMLKMSGDQLIFGRPKFPMTDFEQKISPQMKKVYKSMLNSDPTKRPSWEQIEKMVDIQSISDKISLETCLYTMRFESHDSPLSSLQPIAGSPVKNTGAEYYAHMENLTNWMFLTGLGLADLHDTNNTEYTAAFEVLSGIIYKLAQLLLEKLIDKSANKAEATALQTGFGDFYSKDGGKTLQQLLDTQKLYSEYAKRQIHKAFTSLRKHWKNTNKLDVLLTSAANPDALVSAGMAFGRVASQMLLQGVEAGLVELEVLANARQKLFDAFVCLKYDLQFQFRDAQKKIFDWEKFYKDQPTTAEFDQMFELVYEFFESKHADNDPELDASQFYE